MFGGVGYHSVGFERGGLILDNTDGDNVFTRIYGLIDNDTIGDTGHGLEYAFYFYRRNAVTAAIDDLVFAAQKPIITGTIAARIIPGQEITVSAAGGGFPLEAPILNE